MKMLHKILGCGTVAVAFAFSASTAQAQTIVNPGFEGVGAPNTGNGWTANPISLTSGPAGGTGVDQGWANFDNTSTLQSDMSGSPSLSPVGGSQALYETIAAGNNWQTEGSYQIISGITPGHTYQFSVWASSDTGFTWIGGLVQLGFETPALGGATSVENPGNTVGITANPGINTWKQYFVDATAPAGCTTAVMYLMLQDFDNITYTTPISQAENIYYDNTLLTDITPAPEPTTLALAGLGGAAALSLIRRRKV
jgi:hypothetical protein